MRKLNEEEIKKVREVLNFITNNHSLYCSEYDYVGDWNNNDWEFTAGASKLVAIPKFSNEFVVKVPFVGYSYEEMDPRCACDAFDEYKNHKSIDGHMDSPCDDCCDYNCIEVNYEFSNVPFQAKNYCQAEEIVYEMAKKAGIETLFAETYCLSFEEGDVWIQQRVSDNFLYFNLSPEQQKKLSDEGIRSIDTRVSDCVAISIIEQQGLEMFNKFQSFINEHDINDLHSNNYGSCQNKLMFLDYCGYFR